jgi:hypothetical protein
MSDLRYILMFILILLFKTAAGQSILDSTRHAQLKPPKDAWFNFIQLSGYGGHHLDFEKSRPMLQDNFLGLGFRLGKQSRGFKAWQQVHGYPQYGIGLSYFDLGSKHVDQLFGTPISYYLFYGAPIYHFSNKFRLNADMELGLATAFHKYDPESNPEQNIIGSKTNLHAHLTLELYYKLSERIDMALGLGFIHYSSGRLSTPQKGLNMIGFNASSAYHIGPVSNSNSMDLNYHRPTFYQREISRFEPFSEISIMGSLGLVQAEPGYWKHPNGDMDTTSNQGPRYFTNSASVDYAYQFSYKFKVMTGLDFFYDRSVVNYYENQRPDELRFSDKAFYGAHLGLQYVVGKISLMFHYGRYLYKPFEERGKWYIRCGGRFELARHLDAQLSLKTRDERVSDWIEWGLVYKIKKKSAGK